MKSILEFDLDTREGKMEMARVLKGVDMALVLFELVNNTKKKLKYNENLDYGTLDVVFDEIYNLMEQYDVHIDELVE